MTPYRPSSSRAVSSARSSASSSGAASRTTAQRAALVLAFFSNLFSTLTHYANGPAPVLYGAGYVPMGAWWGVGLLTSVVNIVIWVGVGSFWWRLIGLM